MPRHPNQRSFRISPNGSKSTKRPHNFNAARTKPQAIQMITLNSRFQIGSGQRVKFKDLDADVQAMILEVERYVQAGAHLTKADLCMGPIKDGKPCANTVASAKDNLCQYHQEVVPISYRSTPTVNATMIRRKRR